MYNKRIYIDVRDFDEAKKKRVQDAFFKLSIGWSSGKIYDHLDEAAYTNFYGGCRPMAKLMYDSRHSPKHQAKADITTYEQLMREADMEFTKDDLKDGMVVQYRDGRERVIFNDSAWQVSEPPQVNRRAGRMKQVGHICWLKSDLTHIDGLAHMDLVKVTDRDGTVLFEREPEKRKITLELTDEQLSKIKEIINE